jgi:hypothetical protein
MTSPSATKMFPRVPAHKSAPASFQGIIAMCARVRRGIVRSSAGRIRPGQVFRELSPWVRAAHCGIFAVACRVQVLREFFGLVYAPARRQIFKSSGGRMPPARVLRELSPYVRSGASANCQIIRRPKLSPASFQGIIAVCVRSLCDCCDRKPRGIAGCKFSGNFPASYTHPGAGNLQIVCQPKPSWRVLRELSPCVRLAVGFFAVARRAELPGASSQGIFPPQIRAAAPEIFRSSADRDRAGLVLRELSQVCVFRGGLDTAPDGAPDGMKMRTGC